MANFEPLLPPERRKTYRIVRPLDTHWRPATCAEVACPDFERGWRLRRDFLTEADLHAVKNSGRAYQVVNVGEGETWLVFHAGQPCFRAGEHRAALEREPLYLLQGGDWRRYDRHDRRTLRADQWVDDFATHQDTLADRAAQG